MTRGTLLIAGLMAAACGRSFELPSRSSEEVSTAPLPETTTPSTAGPAEVARAWAPADGFVVHEWGTLTFVVGSDGSLVTGLHHEEEDLPPFVADRMASSKLGIGVEGKMETPVTYFYAPSPLRVSVKVRFPRGIFTQWFPYAWNMAPGVNAIGEDPWLCTIASLPTWCEERLSQEVKNGLLDWGPIDVLARDAAPQLAGPLGDTTWRFARNVASNVLAVPMPGSSGAQQHERFLFYRGLGSVKLPFIPRLEGNRVTLDLPAGGSKVGGLFLMQVTSGGADFKPLGELQPGQPLTAELPAALQPLGEFVPALKSSLKTQLEGDGLYADEAQAMVDTWERSYFKTPGARLLYLLPAAQTDAIIPLEIAPAPRTLRRTMVIRLELLTPSQEQTLVGWVRELGASATRDAAEQRFRAQGRFAEPQLRRALALHSGIGAKEGLALLEALRATRRWNPLAVE